MPWSVANGFTCLIERVEESDELLHRMVGFTKSTVVEEIVDVVICCCCSVICKMAYTIVRNDHSDFISIIVKSV